MSADAVTVSFTRRGRQVVQGLAEGLTDREIAGRIRLTRATVRHHITVASKLVGVRGQAALVNRSYELGLIRPPAREPVPVYVPPQQKELILLLAQSLTEAQIAAKTRRPPSKIRRNTRHLMTSLQANTRAHLVTRAHQYGLLKAVPRTSTVVQT
ncbi:LuxR C-terminal-related transcriptional regulator [Streptomyces sp. WAC 01529]|uniref:LuxR C-terminal-related transcriptional regulator n=1 Tax=Streptomyces sp. WAC 01529 TaxID=2203205 RepID=UPI0013E06524|nr:LuxR C-terminal-related transcriptional regulator [Streptomyces sp. WAC 01529]